MADRRRAPTDDPPPRRLGRRLLGGLFRLLLVMLVLAAIAISALIRPDLPLEKLVQAYATPPSQFVELEGMRVHYRDQGKGRPLLLLHGTAASLHTWDGWVGELAGHRRIVRLDLPGFGLTGPAPDRDYRAARLVRVVVGLLDHLKLSRVDVAGNSLGGRVALELALAHPDRVHKLVLIDAAGMSGQRRPEIVRLARVPLVNKLLVHVTPRFLIRRNLEQVYADPARITDATVDRYHDMARRAGNRQAFVDRASGPDDPDLDERLAGVRAPALLLWGEQDRWIPLDLGRRMHAGLKGSQLLIYPDAGHVPMEELPERTARDADAFLGVE